MSEDMVQVFLPIERAYNAGEWRLSKKVVGKRGGVSWVKIYSCPATGGTWVGQLVEGHEYKVTYWENGFPTSYTFTAKESDAPTKDGYYVNNIGC